MIFESNAYLPPNFWLNADFQNFKWYIHPLYFFRNAGNLIGKVYYCFVAPFRPFWCHFKCSFGSDLLLLVRGFILQTLVCLITLIIMQRKPLTICSHTYRLMDIANLAFYFCFDIENQYALLWTPNAYCDMLMRIFTPCLFFSNAF